MEPRGICNVEQSVNDLSDGLLVTLFDFVYASPFAGGQLFSGMPLKRRASRKTPRLVECPILGRLFPNFRACAVNKI